MYSRASFYVAIVAARKPGAGIADNRMEIHKVLLIFKSIRFSVQGRAAVAMSLSRERIKQVVLNERARIGGRGHAIGVGAARRDRSGGRRRAVCRDIDGIMFILAIVRVGVAPVLLCAGACSLD
jgi:hypothetical protein